MNFLGKIPILKEFEWFEWFEWFGPSPIEPFNSGCHGPAPRQVVLELEAQGVGGAVHEAAPGTIARRECWNLAKDTIE